MTPEYPKRERFFALRFCRVMAKDCLANQIGAEACWLLSVIAHTEDAKGYRAPVTFFNEQLAPLVGCQNVKALARIRDKAVKAGWLAYVPGGKSVAGQYWVAIPPRNSDWDDAPTDEPCPAPRAPIGKEVGKEPGEKREEYTGTKSTQEPGEKLEASGHRTGNEAGKEPGEKREASGQHSSLSLFQDTTHTLPGPAADGARGPAGAEAVGPNPEAVAEHWNAHPGLVPVKASNPHRDRVIRQWATGNADWVAHWRGVIAFMGAEKFYCGAGERGWRADLGWLLKTDNFAAVVERMLAAREPTNTTSTHREPSRTDSAGGGHRVAAVPGKYARPAGNGLQTRRPPGTAASGPAESPPRTGPAPGGSATGVPGADAGAAPVALVPLEPGTGNGQDERGPGPA